MTLVRGCAPRSETAIQPGNSTWRGAERPAPAGRIERSRKWERARSNAPAIAVAVLLVLLHAWLLLHGRPESGNDGIFFKQPALMAVGGKGFILPTAEGFLPDTSVVNGSQPPLESYLTAAAFWALGPGLKVSIGLDVLIHLSFLGTLFLMSRRLGAGPWTGSLLLLSGSFLLWPVGRPDELAALLALLGILVEWSSRRWWLVGLLLGLAALAHPMGALLGGIGVALIELSRSGVARSARRVAAIAVEAFLVFALLWWPAIAADPSLALKQFLLHSTEARYLLRGRELLTFVVSPPSLTLLAAFGTAGLLWGRARQQLPEELRTVLGLFLYWAPLAATVLAVLGSPPAQWKLLLGAGLAVGCAEASWLIRQRMTRRWGPAVALLLASLVLWTGARPMLELVARAAEPAFAGERSVSQDDLQRSVAVLVPPTATIGGSGSLWWVAGPGRAFLDSTYHQGQPPDYMVSTWERTGTLTHLERDGTWGPVLAEQYEPVEAPEVEGDCQVTVLGRRLWGGCDWGVRIWRRRDSALP